MDPHIFLIDLYSLPVIVQCLGSGALEVLLELGHFGHLLNNTLSLISLSSIEVKDRPLTE